MELAVASQSATVTANVGTSINIADVEPVSPMTDYQCEIAILTAFTEPFRDLANR